GARCATDRDGAKPKRPRRRARSLRARGHVAFHRAKAGHPDRAAGGIGRRHAGDRRLPRASRLQRGDAPVGIGNNGRWTHAMIEAIWLLALPFAAATVFVLVHAYFGVHVLRRRIVFADLALAQLAALGATVAFANGHSTTSTAGFAYALVFAGA